MNHALLIMSLVMNLDSAKTVPEILSLPATHIEAARKARTSFEGNDFAEAERIYREILVDLPDHLYVLSNLGVTLFRARELDRAKVILRRAIAVAPKDDFSHCVLGAVLLNQRKYDDAIHSLTKALGVNPKNAAAHYYLGLAASAKGWHDASKKELETATALDPSYGTPPVVGDFLTPLEKRRLEISPR